MNPAYFEPQRFDKLKEVFKEYKIDELYHYDLMNLSEYDIAIIGDDSGSMTIKVEGGSTRWNELKQVMRIIIDLGTAIDDDGIHVLFLNRLGKDNVKSYQEAEPLFSRGPSGDTRLTNAIKKAIGKIKRPKKMLLVIATDGVPNNMGTFKNILRTRNSNLVPISILACSSNDREVGYLNQLDRDIPKLDVLDDFRSERTEVRKRQGQKFPYKFSDHVARLLLGPICSTYDRLDEVKIDRDEVLKKRKEEFQKMKVQYYHQQIENALKEFKRIIEWLNKTMMGKFRLPPNDSFPWSNTPGLKTETIVKEIESYRPNYLKTFHVFHVKQEKSLFEYLICIYVRLLKYQRKQRKKQRKVEKKKRKREEKESEGEGEQEEEEEEKEIQYEVYQFPPDNNFGVVREELKKLYLYYHREKPSVRIMEELERFKEEMEVENSDPEKELERNLAFYEENYKKRVEVEKNKAMKETIETVNTKDIPYEIEISCRAENLDKKDVFGKSDPYFIIYGYQDRNVKYYTSEVIEKELNPKWKKAQLKLVLGKRYFVEVYDWDKGSSDDLIGDFNFVCKDVLHEVQTKYNVCHQEKKKKNLEKRRKNKKLKLYPGSGWFYFDSCVKKEDMVYLEKVTTDLEIQRKILEETRIPKILKEEETRRVEKKKEVLERYEKNKDFKAKESIKKVEERKEKRNKMFEEMKKEMKILQEYDDEAFKFWEFIEEKLKIYPTLKEERNALIKLVEEKLSIDGVLKKKYDIVKKMGLMKQVFVHIEFLEKLHKVLLYAMRGKSKISKEYHSLIRFVPFRV